MAATQASWILSKSTRTSLKHLTSLVPATRSQSARRLSTTSAALDRPGSILGLGDRFLPRSTIRHNTLSSYSTHPSLNRRSQALRHLVTQTTNPTPIPSKLPRSARRLRRLRNLLILLTILIILYQTYDPFRHTVIASVRCARLMRAVIADVLDYKRTFAKEELLSDSLEDKEIRRQARKDCHRRSAERLLVALKTNSGIYVKLGQHVAAVQLLPKEWTSTMTPLQDQCFPTPLAEIDAMLRKDLGDGIDDLFLEFEPMPIGVASLAQVHRAIDRRTGRHVAVKVQHSDLEEFAQVDMVTVNFAINMVKYFFPDFEFDWLGDEMRNMLPLELDFRHEAYNSNKCRRNFAPLEGKTSLYLPEILWAEKRCMVMEYISGSRVDNLQYLKDHGIDRNQVSQELSHIFSKMVYIDGFFHADPHHGNLLIRPKASNSTSPFNFDVCLLDHGQYFDVPEDLRVNYAKFWLSLIKKTTPATSMERRRWAKLVGNIDDDMYPILESAITGRVGIASEPAKRNKRASSLLDNRKIHDEEVAKMRNAMIEREGLIASIFELMRRVPRRLLMILKLSDLQRSLDQSLATTHGEARIFLIVARYCAEAIWRDDLKNLSASLHKTGLSFSLFSNLTSKFFAYAYWRTTLGTVEWGLDVRARFVKFNLWLKGLRKGGLKEAEEVMAGLKV